MLLWLMFRLYFFSCISIVSAVSCHFVRTSYYAIHLYLKSQVCDVSCGWCFARKQATLPVWVWEIICEGIRGWHASSQDGELTLISSSDCGAWETRKLLALVSFFFCAFHFVYYNEYVDIVYPQVTLVFFFTRKIHFIYLLLRVL